MMKVIVIVGLLAALLIGDLFAGTLQPDAETQKKLTPESVLKDLMAGNERYTKGELSDPNVKARVEKAVEGQFPKAYILSCVDSRVPVEQVFDQSIGDIFVGRVAGNVEGTDQLGSIEFATKVAGVKLVMVLGHEACGAVKGACDHVKLGNLTDLLAEITPAVESVEGHEDRSSKNKEFVDDVIEANVRKTVADLRERSEVLAGLEKEGAVKIVGAIYSLHDGSVTLLD
ncbi:carbonic anhydrase [Haloferula helveola]|uniref:Carbonic anhydrase n=1 Tax=Haloferula helveola TaxID=490095 RepID=A0ABN6H7S9_9BACT|nr:carbonic anhydrase [Haloferula helveola]